MTLKAHPVAYGKSLDGLSRLQAQLLQGCLITLTGITLWSSSERTTCPAA